MGVFAVGGALGAVLAYFLDPDHGAGRRHTLRARTVAFARLGPRQSDTREREVSAEAHGFSQKVQHPQEEPTDDDATLVEPKRA